MLITYVSPVTGRKRETVVYGGSVCYRVVMALISLGGR